MQQNVEIPYLDKKLSGILTLPEMAKAVIIFAHGSGSGRLSPRNQMVADFLNQTGFSTLLFDLLTMEEEVVDEQTREFRFNIPLLSDRLKAVTKWVSEVAELNALPIGYFGASTGAGAALLAAGTLEPPLKEQVYAIVSRGGRPDLAGESLSDVDAATLLIIGGLDTPVIELNENILPLLRCRKEMVIISNASHLFEEPGKLDEVMNLTANWFEENLPH